MRMSPIRGYPPTHGDCFSKTLPIFSSLVCTGLCYNEGIIRRMQRFHLDFYGEEWYVCRTCKTAYILETPDHHHCVQQLPLHPPDWSAEQLADKHLRQIFFREYHIIWIATYLIARKPDCVCLYCRGVYMLNEELE